MLPSSVMSATHKRMRMNLGCGRSRRQLGGRGGEHSKLSFSYPTPSPLNSWSHRISAQNLERTGDRGKTFRNKELASIFLLSQGQGDLDYKPNELCVAQNIPKHGFKLSKNADKHCWRSDEWLPPQADTQIPSANLGKFSQMMDREVCEVNQRAV